MKTCEALADLGYEVGLVVPTRRNRLAGDPFDYYGVRTRFRITRLFAPDTVGWGAAGFAFQSIWFGARAAVYSWLHPADVLYGRDEIALAVVGLLSRAPLVWETHTGAWSRTARIVARRAHRVVAISQGLKEFYIAQGVPADKLAVAHDGVDLEQFAHSVSKEEARARLALPPGKKVAMYIGRLDGWKGVNTLLEASKLLPSSVRVAVMGGEEAQIEELSKKYKDVAFLGSRPYRELPDNMAAADVLVLPNTGTDDVSVRFTSPLKLFAYMASGAPIVASDLPSIREVLDENSAYLVAPDDPGALAAGIQNALAGTGERAQNARARVREYSWQRRALRVAHACFGGKAAALQAI
jgi:glycosyltransferase involved in cell wall biosynthesis